MRLVQLILPSLALLLAAAPAMAQGPSSRPRVTAPEIEKALPPAPKPTTPAPRTGAAGAAGSASSSSGLAYLQGVAVDSIHGVPLIGAIIQIAGSDRISVTDSLGRFLVDSIRPGNHQVDVDHPLLDTLGIRLSTQPMTFVGNEVTRVTIGVPSGEFLAGRFCTPARRNLGPGVLAGRVREPDSDAPAVGARVSIVYYDPDPPAIAGLAVPVKKPPRVREATVGADGTYRLCGLPEKYTGKLQAQRKDGGVTAEVAITQEDGVLALRSMSVAPLVVAAAAAKDSATGVPQQRGTAKVSGRVINRAGAPVANARVTLVGHGATAITRANGEFSLDSLPAGTQALMARQLGYAPTEAPVELSSRTPLRGIEIRMGAYVPTLAAVDVVSARDQGLDRVGFASRKRLSAGGYFMGPERLEARRASQFTDYLTTVPGLRVQGSMGQMYVTGTRGAGRDGCVTMFVDGTRWQQLQAGDIDSFIRADDVAAIEVYQQGVSVPVEYTTPGADCTSIVIWTKTHVLRRASNNRR